MNGYSLFSSSPVERFFFTFYPFSKTFFQNGVSSASNLAERPPPPSKRIQSTPFFFFFGLKPFFHFFKSFQKESPSASYHVETAIFVVSFLTGSFGVKTLESLWFFFENIIVSPFPTLALLKNQKRSPNQGSQSPSSSSMAACKRLSFRRTLFLLLSLVGLFYPVFLHIPVFSLLAFPRTT